MNEIDELIKTANNLCVGLEKMSNEDKMFCADIQLWLQNHSWETYKMVNNLKEIREYIGG